MGDDVQAMSPEVPACDEVQPTPAQIDAVMAATLTLVDISVRSVAGVEQQVTLPQLRVLVMIASRGSQNLNSVARALGVHPSNATRACDNSSRGVCCAEAMTPPIVVTWFFNSPGPDDNSSIPSPSTGALPLAISWAKCLSNIAAAWYRHCWRLPQQQEKPHQAKRGSSAGPPRKPMTRQKTTENPVFTHKAMNSTASCHNRANT